LALPRAAFAQSVLLLRPPANDATLSEAFNRLRAELRLQDFEVTVLEPSGENMTPEQLEQEAQAAGAFAGISLTARAGGARADVCIVDRITGKTTQRRLAITDRSQAARVLAVRAVDLLRSSLRELPPGELPPADVVGAERKPEAPEIRAWSAPPRPLWQLRAAGAVLDGPARLGPALGGSIVLSYLPVRRLSTALVLTGPLVGARYTARNGVASVRQELGVARASWNLLPEGRFRLGPLLGAGVYHLQAQSEVASPLRSRSAGVFSFVGTAGIDAELELAPALSIGATLNALLLTPRPIVAIDDAERELKEPLLMASLGLGVAF
jgi:hypothetical protein